MSDRSEALDHTDFKLTSVSSTLTRDLEAAREETQLDMLEERQKLWRVALHESCVSPRRDAIARLLYRGEGITLDDWPGLGPLTAAERTEIIKQTRRILGTPERAPSLRGRPM